MMNRIEELMEETQNQKRSTLMKIWVRQNIKRQLEVNIECGKIRLELVEKFVNLD